MATRDLPLRPRPLDRVRDNLPDEIEPPEIGKFDPNQQPIVILGARSNKPLAELTSVLEEELMRRFQQIPGVGSIEVWGGVYREINVERRSHTRQGKGFVACRS